MTAKVHPSQCHGQLQSRQGQELVWQEGVQTCWAGFISCCRGRGGGYQGRGEQWEVLQRQGQ